MNKAKIWTKEDIKFLELNWNEMSAPELGEKLGRTASSIRQKGKKLGLKTSADRFEKITGLKAWTAEEDEYLRKSWGNESKIEISNKLGRSPAGVERRAHNLGLRMTAEQLEKKNLKKNWTDEMDSFLIENYGTLHVDEICKEVNATVSMVRKRATHLGLQIEKRWTEEEEAYLEDFWGERSVVATAKYLNTSIGALKSKACRMGLGKQLEATGKWYTARDIHEILGVGLRTVYTWKHAGIIKFNRIQTNSKTERFGVSLPNLKIFIEAHPEKYDTRECDMRALKSMFASAKINSSDNLIVKDLPQWLQRKISSDRMKPENIAPRDWTIKELRQLQDYQRNGYTTSQMAEFLKRSEGSVKIKIYKLNKESISA